MTNYTGIDYSSRKVSVATIVSDQLHLWSFNAPKSVVGHSATDAMFEALYYWAAQTSLLLDAQVVIEEPITGASNNRRTTSLMATAFGGIWAMAKFHGASNVMFAYPSQWKKAVVGSGSATKEEVIAWLASHYPDTVGKVRDDDEADAVCLALLSRMFADASL